MAISGFANRLWNLAALACVLGLTTMVAAEAADSKPGVYGKKLVASQEVPLEMLAQYARFVAKKTTNPATIYAETQDWVAQEVAMVPGDSPYTVVLKVSGTAKEDGDANAYFQPGWAGDNGKSSGIVIEVGKAGARAGELIELSKAIAPVSVKEAKSLAPWVGYSGGKNFNITNVSIEVWSGMPKASLPAMLMAWSPLLGGLVFLALFLWWRK